MRIREMVAWALLAAVTYTAFDMQASIDRSNSRLSLMRTYAQKVRDSCVLWTGIQSPKEDDR